MTSTLIFFQLAHWTHLAVDSRVSALRTAMKRCLIYLVTQFLACACFAAQPPGALVKVLDDETVIYRGRIDQLSVSRLIADTNGKRIKTLVIDSQGGELLAGITLGEWVWRERIDVEVRRLCMSACANYVFTAAKRKILSDGALVIWHGGAEQKNFREEDDFYQRISDRANEGAQLTDAERDYLEKHKRRHENSLMQRKAQRAFFARIGVDEYLTRLGQEPISFNAAWTVNVETLEALGVRNVLAPKDYGSDAYIDRASSAIGLASRPVLVKPILAPTP